MVGYGGCRLILMVVVAAASGGWVHFEFLVRWLMVEFGW